MTTITTVDTRRIFAGNRNDDEGWEPFEWVEPKLGPQTKGEYIVIRPGGTGGGSHTAGLWRAGRGLPGASADGSTHVDYSAPDSDETVVILEGSAEITVVSTGKRYHIEAGSILSHPKGLEITWDIKAPFLKKFWVLWNGEVPGVPGDDVYVSSINADPDTWVPFEWVDPDHGSQVSGELTLLRDTGATGQLLAGVWRVGIGNRGSEPDGRSSVPYRAPGGDETMLLLEGTVHVVNEETGEEYDFAAGDVIGLPTGLPVRWTSNGPFVKKFFVITRDEAQA
jgi:Protein of unknown function (DUF861).